MATNDHDDESLGFTRQRLTELVQGHVLFFATQRSQL